MNQWTYIFKTLLVYGFVFFLSFYAIKLSLGFRIDKKLNSWRVGFLIAFVAFATIGIVSKLELVGIPDAKFYLAGFVTYFFGVLPGVVVSSVAIISKVYFDHSDPLGLGVMFAVIHLIYYGIQRLKVQFKIKETFVFFSILSLISSTSVLITSALWFGKLSEFGLMLSNSIVASLLGMIFMAALSTVFCDEKAMYASIDALKRSYDELLRTKDKMEFLALHEVQTGFFNIEKINQEILLWYTSNQNKPMQLLLLGIHNRDGLKQMLGSTLFDIAHFTVGAEVKSLADHHFENVFCSLDKGKYALLIKGFVDQVALDAIMDELSRKLVNVLLVHNSDVNVAVEIGGVVIDDNNMALCAPNGNSVVQWLDLAESAYLKVVLLGSEHSKKIVWFEKHMYEEQKNHAKLINALMTAIKEEQFTVVYQPQFNKTGKIIGAEALVRWYSSEFGNVAPDKFIELAERQGFVGEIDAQVLNNVCRFIKDKLMSLQVGSQVIPISVNVSFLELINFRFIDHLVDTLKEYGIGNEWLRLEVTETSISSQYSDVIETLKRLDEKGFYIYLDDFGTGYSSLNHLGRMPVRSIKIDKSFIDQILEDSKIGEIVSMAIDFANRLNLDVVAEGVELLEQAEWLIENNCEKFQGYYFSRPLSPDAFLDLVSKNS